MDLDQRLANIEKILQKLEKDEYKDRLIIDSHPFLFMFLVVFFFFTMDLWIKAITAILLQIYPKKEFKWLEYTILAIISLTIFLYLTSKTNIAVRLL